MAVVLPQRTAGWHKSVFRGQCGQICCGLPQIVASPRDAACGTATRPASAMISTASSGPKRSASTPISNIPSGPSRYRLSAAPSGASEYAVAHAARSTMSACWRMPPSRPRRHQQHACEPEDRRERHRDHAHRNISDPPTISVRPLNRGSPPVSHSPPSNAPNASAPASMPVSAGDTMNTCRPIGATNAE